MNETICKLSNDGRLTKQLAKHILEQESLWKPIFTNADSLRESAKRSHVEHMINSDEYVLHAICTVLNDTQTNVKMYGLTLDFCA